MSDLTYCQGTKCHQYFTQDRIKGQKGNKTNQTRRRSKFYYGDSNFCSMNCWNDWFNDFGDRAINHFGRTVEAKHLKENNAWFKDYDWGHGEGESHIYYCKNQITKERRPITEQQYEDRNFNLNTV